MPDQHDTPQSSSTFRPPAPPAQGASRNTDSTRVSSHPSPARATHARRVRGSRSPARRERRSTHRLVEDDEPSRQSSVTWRRSSSVYSLGSARRRRRSERAGEPEHEEPAQPEGYTEGEVVPKRGLGLAAKFTIPVCVVLGLAVAAWASWIGQDIEHKLLNKAKRYGVREVSTLAGVGRLMLVARETHPGAWPIVSGVLTREDVAKRFGTELEKRLVALGFGNPAQAREQLLDFDPGHPINRKNEFGAVGDLVARLGHVSVEDAVADIDALRSRYRELYDLPPAPAEGARETWLGLSDAPHWVYDAPPLADRINDLIARMGLLQEAAPEESGLGNPEPLDTEVVEAYLRDSRGRRFAARGPRISAPVSFVPIRRADDQFLTVDGHVRRIREVDVVSGEASGEPCIAFSRPIDDPATGVIVGSAHLVLSAKRIFEE